MNQRMQCSTFIGEGPDVLTAEYHSRGILWPVLPTKSPLFQRQVELFALLAERQKSSRDDAPERCEMIRMVKKVTTCKSGRGTTADSSVRRCFPNERPQCTSHRGRELKLIAVEAELPGVFAHSSGEAGASDVLVLPTSDPARVTFHRLAA
jgi:hypothetical protein